MQIKNTLALFTTAALLAGFVGTSAHATTIYFDDFDGSSGTNLHGTTPDVGANNWVATSTAKADGSFTTPSDTTTFTLGFTPVHGTVYTLDAQFETVGGSQWIQFGYGTSQPTAGLWTTGPWNLLRQAGGEGSGHYAVPGNGTGGLTKWTSLDSLNYDNDMDVRIVLDTTGGTGFWTATWFAKAGNVGTYTQVRAASAVTDETINAIGVSTYNSGANTGKLNSISLTQIPEPGSLALLGLGGLLIARRRRG